MDDAWIVGVEPDGNHDGPLHFAVAMQRRSRPPIDVRGIHVLPTARRVGEEARVQLEAHAETACHAALVRTEARDVLHEIAILESDGVEAGLEHAIAQHGASVCVIGRRALRREIRFQRLGPVARHMMRRLPCTTIVVPPDWISVHDGPVVLATDMGEHSEHAARFARSSARRLRVPLLVVHTSRHGDWAGPHFEGRAFQGTLQRIRETATQELEAWVRAQGLEGAIPVVHLGDPVSDIAAFATEERASLIVCGSRHLGGVARLFGHSVASELAAIADVPVAVAAK